MNAQRLSRLTLASLLALGLAACGGDENPGPSDDTVIIPTAGSGSDAGSGGSSGDAGSGDSSGDAGSGGSGGSGIDVTAPVRDDCPDEANDTQRGNDCWDLSECNGTDSVQFLEQCSGTCIAPFDNQARIEGYAGSLPSLN